MQYFQVKRIGSVETVSSLAPMFNHQEIEVAGILLEIPRLIFDESNLNECRTRKLISFSWNAKRQRTYSAEKPVVEAKVLSPVTPLSFSACESDDKPLHPSKKIKTPEEWLNNIQEELKVGGLLDDEVQNLVCHYASLLKNHFALKARKQELTSGQSKQEEVAPIIEEMNSNSGSGGFFEGGRYTSSRLMAAEARRKRLAIRRGKSL